MARRVAVTGIGVVASCGVGTDAFWEGLHRPPPDGEVLRIDDFDPMPWFNGNPKEVRRADRFQQFALAAAGMALEQSGPLTADPLRTGVMIGTGIGGLITIEDQTIVRHEKGPRRVSPFLIPMVMGNAPAAAVSMRHGFQGPCKTVVTACATGTHAIANAARLITTGRCDAVVAGSTEAAMTETGVAGFRNMTALSSTGHSRPFDARRDGFVMSEGAGVLVLEEWELAEARGATILGEVLGGASSADAHHITAPAPGGAGAIACMERALAETNRRREKQIAYNAANGITPQSVKSNIKEIVDSVYEKDHVTVSIGNDKSGKEEIQVGANLAAVIKDYEAQMREAATNLEFEKAARLRDEVRRLKSMELDTLEGATD